MEKKHFGLGTVCCKEATGDPIARARVVVVATGTPVSAESGPVGPLGRWGAPPAGWGSLKRRGQNEQISNPKGAHDVFSIRDG